MKSIKFPNTSTAKTSESSSNKAKKTFGHSRKPKESKFVSGFAENMQEKAHYHVYSGLCARTVKFFWEQHDTTDIDVVPEVFEHIALDATYKLWDLVNTLKTYAKHSGGKITYSLVNEVLKDVDTSVILGSNGAIFDKTEYDGSFYFSIEDKVDLRLTNLQQVEVPISQFATVETSWSTDGRNRQVLFEFASILCAGLFLSDYKSYKRTLHSAALNFKLGAVSKIILKKCAKILEYDQTFKMANRCMEFLRILFFNIRLSGAGLIENTSYLSGILKSLAALPLDWQTRVEYTVIRNKKNNFESYTDSSEENISRKRARIISNIDQPKQLSNKYLAQLCHNSKFTLFKNKFLSDYAENMYTTLGVLSNNCALFQSDYALILLDQIDDALKKTNSSDNNDEIYASIFKGIFTLGENAFLKLIPNLSKLGSNVTSESLSSYYCVGGKMLKNENHSIIYNWLEDTAGDQLIPFLVDVSRSFITKTVVSKPVDKKSKFNFFSKYEHNTDPFKSIDILFASLQITPRIIKSKIFDLYSFESTVALAKLRKLRLPSFLNSVRVNYLQDKALVKKTKVLKPVSNRSVQCVYSYMML